ncbi:hypothetical protein ACFQ3Z_00315 [Streptomyces nogalater]
MPPARRPGRGQQPRGEQHLRTGDPRPGRTADAAGRHRGRDIGAGSYKATPLSASSTWEAGGSSGSFTWSYPCGCPGRGPQPDLTISYDSGAVDGQTANSNNQGSQIGTGFDLTSSYIERKYHSCDDDGQDGKYDLCWKYDNASLVLNGKATELVKDDQTGTWRLKDDDASTVTHSTGADNGDEGTTGVDGAGEYWTVVTGNGTKYVFGLNKLDGAGTDDRTNSVWTVPVFGDDQGEPGYSAGDSFATRAKSQAWRWNLDYIEDTHGNASSYWYTAEHNNYDKLGDDTTGTDYVRGGYLKEIRYGQRAGKLFSASPAASDKVVFDYAERCLATGTGCDSLTKDTRDNWPDVPFDALCKDGDKCTGNVGPSFFTRKRLTTITTYAWNAKAATPATSRWTSGRSSTSTSTPVTPVTPPTSRSGSTRSGTPASAAPTSPRPGQVRPRDAAQPGRRYGGRHPAAEQAPSEGCHLRDRRPDHRHLPGRRLHRGRHQAQAGREHPALLPGVLVAQR